ncbi:hypothetical protein N7478_002327 [Penicillium angulare]|uniref:uncharacterized protein n=1 Tax=Penicillium angulare TaxID=116970 RepID=UPI00253F9F09|nr:uncharacterized protein N7478_002327 [Penicillium angulare]KAJ5286641.1 hypothetical protein N7478_002327 [Penicillium angulare]
MALPIPPVQIQDVDILARKVEFPAHANGPLRRVMFPSSTEQQSDETEDEARWLMYSFCEVLDREDEVYTKRTHRMVYLSDSKVGLPNQKPYQHGQAATNILRTKPGVLKRDERGKRDKMIPGFLAL